MSRAVGTGRRNSTQPQRSLHSGSSSSAHDSHNPSGLVNAKSASSGDHRHRSEKGKSLKKKWLKKAGAGWTLLSVLDWWIIAGGWLTWRGVLLRWTPLGFCLIAAAQWHLHNLEMDKKGLPRTATQWQVSSHTFTLSLPHI